MVDNKSIIDQIHELQVIVNKLTILKIIILEIFQVGVIISKFPPSWKGFAKKPMHMSEDFTLEEIQKTLRIEEEARKRMSKNYNQEGINYVQGSSSKKPNKNFAKTSSKRKFVPSNNSGGGQKSSTEKAKSPMNKHCYVCGEPGHFAKNCSKRRNGPKVVNFVEEDNFVAMVTEVSTKLTYLSL